MINDLNTRTLLSLNEKQSLCIVTMILSVYLFAINWKASPRLFRLSNSVCPTKMLNMNELDRMKQLSSARKLKEREETPEPFEDPYYLLLRGRFQGTGCLEAYPE